MGLLDNFIAGAVGYGISEMSKSHPLRDVIDERINRSKPKVSLEELIREYTKQYEIYTRRNEFAYHLHKIAEQYEEYDYDEMYGSR